MSLRTPLTHQCTCCAHSTVVNLSSKEELERVMSEGPSNEVGKQEDIRRLTHELSSGVGQTPPFVTMAMTESQPKNIKPAPVNQAVVKFIEKRQLSEHHPWWHVLFRWEDLNVEQRRFLMTRGWQPPVDEHGHPTKQEGQRGNGIKFAAMHGYMVELLYQQPGFQSVIPAWGDAEIQAISPQLSKADLQCVTMLNELIHASTNNSNTEIKTLFQERGFDAFANWVESQRAKKNSDLQGMDPKYLTLAGVHNRVHVAFSDNSPINMGDPGRNLFNVVFWGWHGFLNNAFNAYLKLYASAEEKQQYEQEKKDEGSRMDSQFVQDITAAMHTFSMTAIAEDQKILRSIRDKAQPIASADDVELVKATLEAWK